MSENQTGSSTLELLAQYNDHRSQKDKEIEYIERRTGSTNDDKPSYDELFKENVKLKLLLEDYENEIDGLKRTISNLRNKRLSTVSSIDKDVTSDVVLDQTSITSRDSKVTKKDLVLPPRSTDRRSKSKNLTIPIPPSQNTVQVDEAPISSNNNSAFLASRQPSNATTHLMETLSSRTTSDSGSYYTTTEDSAFTKQQVNTPRHVSNASTKSTKSAHSGSTNHTMARILASPAISNNKKDNMASPATSVTYTTSRITIKSPNRSNATPFQERVTSPQHSNRMASVINNHIHSPMKQEMGISDDIPDFTNPPNHLDMELEHSGNMNPYNSHNNHIGLKSPSKMSSNGNSAIDSPLAHLNRRASIGDKNRNVARKDMDFSPGSKEKLTNFSQLLDNSFGEEEEEEENEEDEEIIQRKPINNGPPEEVSFSPHSLTSAFLPNPPVNISTPTSNQLGSPVILNRNMNQPSAEPVQESVHTQSPAPTSLMKNNVVNEILTDLHLRGKDSKETLTSPNTEYTSEQSPLLTKQRSADLAKTSNPETLNNLVSDIPLFVQPSELSTVNIEVVSTLYNENTQLHDLSNPEENFILFSIIDKNSNKEMFKFSKTLQRVKELDVYLKSHSNSNNRSTMPTIPCLLYTSRCV